MFDPSIYTIAWVCAIVPELVAAQLHLDEEHDSTDYVQPANDNNAYIFGKIGLHNVVIAALSSGEYGTSSAAGVARDLIRSFTNVKIGFMVGIAGGAPLMQQDDGLERDIRLGDVVVSIPGQGRGGVHQYDYGKAIQGQIFEPTGHLNAPPHSVLTAITVLRSKIAIKGHGIVSAIDALLAKNENLREEYCRPPSDCDHLYEPSYVHPSKHKTCNSVCVDSGRIVDRKDRAQNKLVTIHYGLIASGNTLMKDATMRDTLARTNDILCFEMEAAGLMNQLPFLVIRGICDYADSHKNKEWQNYAAMTAAAYAKLLLNGLAVSKIEAERNLVELAGVVNDVKNTLEMVHETVQTQAEKDTERQLRQWLAAPDPTANHRAALQKRHPGTGSWLLESESFGQSLRSSQLVWLHGLSGCGKTVLAASIIQSLYDEEPKTVLYFYFDFREGTKQTYESLLRSLIWQVYLGRPQYRQCVRELEETCHGQHASEEQLNDCLQRMLGSKPGYKIVLDALDECTQRPKIYSWLRMFNGSTSDLKFIITSRPEHDIVQSLTLLTSADNNIDIQDAPVDADIRAYTRFRIEHDEAGFGRWRNIPAVQQLIQDVVTSKAKGMFRWAACQLDALGECCRKDEIEEQLASLPDDLNQTYSQILRRIPRPLFPSTKRLLSFLAFVLTPPTVEELVDALAVSFRDGARFDPENRMPDVKELSKLAPSLIMVSSRPKWRWTMEKLPSKFVVQLAHLSVKEYVLASDNLSDNMAGSLEVRLAHSVIAKTCLAYLLSLDAPLGKKIIDVPPVEVIETAFPLAKLAANAWIYHASLVSGRDDLLHKLILQFCTTDAAFELGSILTGTSSRLLSSVIAYEHLHADVPLHLVARAGLRDVVVALLDSGINVSTPGHSFDSALCAAASGGHIDIVNVLLERGAEVNISSVEAFKAMRGAKMDRPQASEPRVTTSYNFMDAGVNDYEFKRLEFRPGAFYWACLNGHTEIARLLLENGADADDSASTQRPERRRGHNGRMGMLTWPPHNEYYGTALAAACFGGHREVVALLLQHNASDRTARSTYEELKYRHDGDERFTVLVAAASQGWISIVKLLLEWGAKPDNMPRGCRVSALGAACEYGHLDIVKLLISEGADINLKMGDLSALACACEQDDISIVELLLDHGFEVNDTSQEISALTAACRSGQIRAAELLILRGAHINPAPEPREQHVARCELASLYTVLHDQWVESDHIDAKNELRSIPLSVALQHGRTDVVRLLIRNGATIPLHLRSAVDLRFWHSGRDFDLLKSILFRAIGSVSLLLREAAQHGRINLLHFLLDLDVRLENDALEEAASHGHSECVRLLLDANAPVTTAVIERALLTDNTKSTLKILLRTKDHLRGVLLTTAIRGSHRKTVEQLLDSGVMDAGQALDEASACDDLEMMQLLLARGSTGTWHTLFNEVAAGRVDSVRSFLARGVRVNNMTLTAAICGGNQELFRLLLEATERPETLSDLLCKAAAHGDEGMVTMLLDAGADINAISKTRRCTRWQPATWEVSVPRLLCRWPKIHQPGTNDPSRCEGYTGTALQVSAHFGHQGLTRMLLARGVDTSLPGPVHCAAAQGHTEIMQDFLLRGFDANIEAMCCKVPGSYGWHNGTPLAAAQAANREQAIVLLKEHGAADSDDSEHASSWRAVQDMGSSSGDCHGSPSEQSYLLSEVPSDVLCKCKTAESLTFSEERRRKPRRRKPRRRDSFDIELVRYM